MGGIIFAWLDVWVLSPDCLSQTGGMRLISSRLGEAAAPVGGEVRAVPPTSHRVP